MDKAGVISRPVEIPLAPLPLLEIREPQRAIVAAKGFLHYVLLGFTVILLVRPAAVAQPQHASTSPPLPPPGRLIDLGGWRVHLYCTGEARTSQPTVILEAGAGDFSVDWSLVQPDVARFARVCSYDRAGAGWSDLGPRPRTMHQVAWELRTLLEKAGERPPYVLVGHSFGGWLVRVFASTYRLDVAAVVLCESGDERGLFSLKDGKGVSLVETATGRPLPAVKRSDPLRESDIPAHIRSMIEAQIREENPSMAGGAVAHRQAGHRVAQRPPYSARRA